MEYTVIVRTAAFLAAILVGWLLIRKGLASHRRQNLIRLARASLAEPIQSPLDALHRDRIVRLCISLARCSPMEMGTSWEQMDADRVSWHLAFARHLLDCLRRDELMYSPMHTICLLIECLKVAKATSADIDSNDREIERFIGRATALKDKEAQPIRLIPQGLAIPILSEPGVDRRFN